jgi:ABC-type amino acid transport substrate-binding protein
MMKKLVIILFAAILLLGATACGKARQTDPLADNVLTIGTDSDFVPMEYRDKHKALKGFEIDLGNAIAQKMGVRAFWIDTGWNSIFNRMNAGKYDCVMSAINDTTARKQNFAMTDPYFISSIVIVSRKETGEQQADAGNQPAKETIDRAEKLNGRKVGMLKDIKRRDTMTDLQTRYPKIKIKGFSNSAKLFKALKRKKIDHIVVDEAVAITYQKRDPEHLAITSAAINQKAFAIACRKDNGALSQKISRAIADLKADGTYRKLTLKWFGRDMTKDTLTQTMQ